MSAVPESFTEHERVRDALTKAGYTVAHVYNKTETTRGNCIIVKLENILDALEKAKIEQFVTNLSPKCRIAFSFVSSNTNKILLSVWPSMLSVTVHAIDKKKTKK